MQRRKFVQRLSATALFLLSNGVGKTTNAKYFRQNAILRFAVTSDGHYGEPGTSFESNFNNVVNAINDFHAAQPFEFSVINGDIIHNNPDFLLPASKLLKQCKMPFYVTKGNHDMVSPERWMETWGMGINHDVVLGENVLLLGTTADETGKYLCPDQEWFTAKLEQHKSAKNIFIFLHITPVKWTKHAVDCQPFQKLLQNAKNVRAVFNGHDHDQDGIKFLGNVPFLFDGHFGGSWGTAYQGFRVVELLEDNSLLTYMMDPHQKLAELNIYRQNA
ncbi:MAG TPA: metallophosphoesterase [Agriterribacter sp.]|nr:metallophosphoesterase [Agriterribacter sp.]